jgi:DNA invertase Pin-like site-specific DNA recombinase
MFMAGTGALPVLGMLTIPLAPRNPGEPLRVLIIGRISTPHQRQESIEASYEFVEKFLRQAYDGPLLITRLGEQASGMVADRPTIRAGEDLIAAGKVDLILVEDVGRIYRDPRHLIAFVNDTVDADVRLISVNDNLDTAEEDWEIVLQIAMVRHGFAATDARKKVNRTATYAFHKGGDVKKVPFGYRKLSKEEAASGEFGTVGLRMAKLSECTSVIQQMRTMVLDGYSYEMVADWLNIQGIKPGRFCKCKTWTAQGVINLLRSPLLHGEREIRKVIYQRIRKTGKHKRVKNPKPERKLYPELAHLTLEEHNELLVKMDGMARERRRHKGGEHPRTRVPRSAAIWPSALDARCSVCADPAYIYDRDSLKCSNSFLMGKHQCWNHVQADRDRIRLAVMLWLMSLLQQTPAAWTAFLDAAWQEIERRRAGSGSALTAELNELQRLTSEADRLAKAIADGGTLHALLKLLEQTEALISESKARCDMLKVAAADELPFDREALLQNPLTAILELSRTSFEFADLLRQVITQLTIVPVQDILCGQVRPRIRVTVSFAALEDVDGSASNAIVHTAIFDLFDLPKPLHYLDSIRRLAHDNPHAAVKTLAEKAGTDRHIAARTLLYLHAMEQAGVDQPFIEVTQRPQNASRWRDKRRKINGDGPKEADQEPRRAVSVQDSSTGAA